MYWRVLRLAVPTSYDGGSKDPPLPNSSHDRFRAAGTDGLQRGQVDRAVSRRAEDQASGLDLLPNAPVGLIRGEDADEVEVQAAKRLCARLGDRGRRRRLFLGDDGFTRVREFPALVAGGHQAAHELNEIEVR